MSAPDDDLQFETVVDHNPQHAQMADESMVRNLSAQAEAIWPQEVAIVEAYGPAADVLDVGCGTGEITSRLAHLHPVARITGVDLIESHLEIARTRCAHLGSRVTFRPADAFALPFADACFDLVVCRHVLQAVPKPGAVLAEMVRVTRPGGRLHLLCEDYDMIHAAPARLDVGSFWHVAPRVFGGATRCDVHIGRNIHALLRDLPVTDVRTHYAIVDTERVPRDTFATIFEAWRDGYAGGMAQVLGWSVEDVRDHFDATIECIRTGYAVWFVPIVSARVTVR